MRSLLTTCALLLICASVPAQTLPCESLGTYRECRIATSGRVRLIYELSERICFEGVSWGTASDGVVWVDRGWSARFRVDSVDDSTEMGGAHVVCESLTGDLELCRADGTRGVALVQQYSKAPCVKDKSWGYSTERGRIWVDDGCRAEFAVRGKVTLSAVTCESHADARSHCPADTKLGVALIKRLGESRCILGTSWGIDDDGVWVSDGCHAEFAVAR